MIFDEFLGDHGLTRAVVDLRLLLDHLARVARGGIHGTGACALLGGRVLEERAEHLDGEVARQERVEDRFLTRLELQSGIRSGTAGCGQLGWDELLGGRHLGDDGAEARVEQRRHVELAIVETRDDALRDLGSKLVIHRLVAAQVTALDNLVAILATQEVVALLADRDDLHRLAFGRQRADVLAGQTHDR